MGGVQSGTHSLGDALWIQERQRQKYYRDGNGGESNDHGVQPPQQHHHHHHHHHHQQQQPSTQERRKLLKRTRSLAVISEDECRAANDRDALRLGARSPFDTSSLQHRRPQLIPRAKLIDRHSLKDRLCKSQQHLSDSYEGFSDVSVRPSPSRSVCGLYSLPPPLGSLPDPLPYTRAGAGESAGRRPIPEHSGKLNILKWPDSPKRYRSFQDLNSVGGLVDIVEDNYWPDEENRSVECIYTQVKRKRKEHRSLDSILFEDDSDELEYFDILNLLPLSNVRLEIDEPNAKNKSVILERNSKFSSSQELKSHPSVLSVLTKKSNVGNKTCSLYEGGVSITEIEDLIPAKIDGEKTKARIREYSDNFDAPSNKSMTEKDITSYYELAREKDSESASHVYDDILDILDQKDNPQLKTVAEPYYLKTKHNTLLDKDNKLIHKNNEALNLQSEDNRNINEKSKIKEIDNNKVLCLADIKEINDMSRRPQVLKIIDNDVTKSKNQIMLVTPDITFSGNDATCTEHIYENIINNDQTGKSFNKPDLINDHIYGAKTVDKIDINTQTMSLSVENARNFFEKKNIDKESLINHPGELHKSRNIRNESLGFEATSESSDLGLGSETGSDVRRLSADENTNTVDEKITVNKKSNGCMNRIENKNNKNEKNYTNLTRSRSCIDSIESQVFDEPEFDHVRYKIVKSNIFSKNIYNNSKSDVSYDGLMQYFREFSFQDLLMDNNVVIIEPVRAEVERKSSFNEVKTKSTSNFKTSQTVIEKINDAESYKSDKDSDGEIKNHFIKAPRQSSLRKHFFYQPIRVNRELNDDELPDPDTVRNVRKMFEETMRRKLKMSNEINEDYNTRNSVSMKDLRTIESGSSENGSENAADLSRSRCSSRAKDLRKIFENLDKSSSLVSISEIKDDVDNIKNESKTRTIVQSFESRSGQTSPSNSNSSKGKINKYHQRQLHNWDAGSVSSGVSSDYPDTDVGSALPCTSSEDEELYCQDDDGVHERYEGHFVSQDVLKKIREYGTSVTYYGGKVVNTYNGPLICPMVCKKSKISKKSLDYIKFRLVKSNSCDSRLELTGRVDNYRNKYQLNRNQDKGIDLRQFTIDETPSIEITSIEQKKVDEVNDKAESKEEKREPPVVIGLEPKKEENKTFKVDFKLGKLDDCASINRFTSSALTRWQINENTCKRTLDFGKIEFEEYEVLEDSLNGVNI